jgi:ATP-dependent DNA helicase RecG
LAKAAETYVRNYIRWRVEFDGSLQRKEIPEIPMDAVREAIINSFCHRDFRSSQNNEVTIYKDRVEIYNPGTFPEGLTPQDFIKGSERSIPRNPVLARLMYYSRDIEHFGTGLKRITKECDEAGVKVEFQMLKKGFVVVFYRPDEDYSTSGKNPKGTSDVPTNDSFNVPIKSDDPVSDPVSDPVNDPVSDPVNDPVNVPVNKVEQHLLALITENPAITWDEVAQSISKSRKTVQRYFKSLKDKNIIRRVGSDKFGHWEVIAPIGKEPR